MQLGQNTPPIRKLSTTVMTLSFRTDRSGQTVQTQIRLLLEEQSDQGLHCLLFHLHLFDEIPKGLGSLFELKVDYRKVLGVRKFRNFTVLTQTCVNVCEYIQSFNINDVMRKPAFCIYAKIKAQCAADQHLCFRYFDSTITSTF